jgi:peptide/nickel transport system permease protein
MVWLVRRVGAAILLAWVIASFIVLSAGLAPAGSPMARGGSLAAQYLDGFAGLLTGDLGRSLRDDAPVAGAIASRLPHTLELLGMAGVLALLIGVPAGFVGAMDPRGFLDRAGSWLSAIALTVPVFVAGVLISLLIGGTTRSVPAPAMALALGLAAATFRTMRRGVRNVASRAYVRTARAKGVSAWRILWYHVLRNAMVPVTASLLAHTAMLLGAAVPIEYVFDYPGVGALLVEAVKARDLPMAQGIVLTISMLFVGLSLAIDILRGVLDPRIRTA